MWCNQLLPSRPHPLWPGVVAPDRVRTMGQTELNCVLLSSSLLLFPQRISQYYLWPSSGVCRTREPSRNFELRPLLNPQGSPVLIPLAITGYKC